MRDILLMLITAFCALTALRRPPYGMLAYVGYSLLAPHSMTWGIARTFPHAQLLALCTMVGYVFWSESKRFPRQRESVLLLVVWSLFGFSTLFALSPDDAVERLIHISKILLMVFFAMALINTEERLHALVRTIALSVGFYGIKVGLFVLKTAGQSTVIGPENSFLEANNTLGMALVVNVPLLFYLAKGETRAWLRWLMQGMLVLSYPAIAGTFSRGAWVALAVVTALMVVKSQYKFMAITAAGVVVIVAVAWLPQIVSQGMADRYDSLVNYEEDPSAQSRFWNWEFCARVGFTHPFNGGGFDYYSLEAYATYYPEFLQRWPGKIWSCHNMWLTIFGEHGIPAFLLWVGLLASCFLSLRRMKSYAKSHVEMTWVVRYADMLQAAFVGYMISGSFLDIAYFEVYYFLIVIVIVMKERIQLPISFVRDKPKLVSTPGKRRVAKHTTVTRRFANAQAGVERRRHRSIALLAAPSSASTRVTPDRSDSVTEPGAE